MFNVKFRMFVHDEKTGAPRKVTRHAIFEAQSHTEAEAKFIRLSLQAGIKGAEIVSMKHVSIDMICETPESTANDTWWEITHTIADIGGSRVKGTSLVFGPGPISAVEMIDGNDIIINSVRRNDKLMFVFDREDVLVAHL